jgi:hypothetical protein
MEWCVGLTRTRQSHEWAGVTSSGRKEHKAWTGIGDSPGVSSPSGVNCRTHLRICDKLSSVWHPSVTQRITVLRVPGSGPATHPRAPTSSGRLAVRWRGPLDARAKTPAPCDGSGLGGAAEVSGARTTSSSRRSVSIPWAASEQQDPAIRGLPVGANAVRCMATYPWWYLTCGPVDV